MVFDQAGLPVSSAYREHRQVFPEPGWVEHDPLEIWRNTLDAMAEALETARLSLEDLAAVGVTNQRETTVVWEAASGLPVRNAIVWQDRRTSTRCSNLVEEGLKPFLRERTGLPPDPYFSATKLEWLLDHVEGLRERGERGEVLFGTIDCWLIWNLTGVHATDPTNASRTLLFNLKSREWDEELLTLFRIPRAMLPKVLPSVGGFGEISVSDPRLTGSPPILGNLGDQQAALFGQAGFSAGEMKCTHGTGSFLLSHVGSDPVWSRMGLLSTIAHDLGGDRVAYALEGSVFVTGAAVQWLRDGLGIIRSAEEIEALAGSVSDTGGLALVPAFAGLGTPHWNSRARGTLVGVTRGTTSAHLARAALESIALQTRDVLEAAAADLGGGALQSRFPALKVDGGAVRNNLLCQIQSDILGIPVVRPRVNETTALGAAYAAGLSAGCWADLEGLRRMWKVDRVFEPRWDEQRRQAAYSQWKRAVGCALTWASGE